VRQRRINKKYEELINDFIDLSDKLDVRIIHDKGDFHGDDCLLFANNVIVINKHKPLEQRVNVLAKCFSKMKIDNIYIKPVLRELIDKVESEK
tara:strand:- start:45 stop:323 length:279 start_codon:yes stop_codon:yes gene_type:complete